MIDLTEISKVQKLSESHNVISNDVVKVIQEVKEELSDVIFKTNAIIEINAGRYSFIVFSEENFRRIILNVLSNALKFRSPLRVPRIVISAFDNDQFIILQIKDNGIGITKEYMSKVFSMFKKGHEYKMGRGIGLYIVKRLIENEGVTVELESEEGIGTTVKLYFKKY